MADEARSADEELAERARSGERGAFQQLAEAHAGALYRCAWSLARDRQFAEDLAQETLIEAWRSIARFDGRCRISTWLYGILRHRYLKAVRRFVRSVPADQPFDAAVAIPSEVADPVQPTQQAEEARQVRLAVARLPEEHRLVIEMRFFGGASLDEIAVLLGIPPGTVKSRLHNGLEKLRRQEILVNLVAIPGESPARRL